MIADNLGLKLQAMRKRLAGVSQAELSRRLGEATSTVSLWESGKRTPGAEDIERYASACGMRADLVFTPAHVKVKQWGPDAHEAANLMEMATPGDRALCLAMLRRMVNP